MIGSTRDILDRTKELLEIAKLGLKDLKEGPPERRIAAIYNIVVFGRAVTNAPLWNFASALLRLTCHFVVNITLPPILHYANTASYTHIEVFGQNQISGFVNQQLSEARTF